VSDDEAATPPFTCPCCKLRQPREADQHGVSAPVCRHCTWHQTPTKRLERAEKHEELLRDRLTRCYKASVEAEAEARRAKEAMRSALASRGRLAIRLDDAGSAMDHRRLAALTAIARDSNVREWAKKQRSLDEPRFGVDDEWYDD
jgi:hypothetical protein